MSGKAMSEPGAASGSARERSARLRGANARTALVLLAIALVFFFGVIATRLFSGSDAGIAVLGAAVLLFLSLAIGRNLFRGRKDGK